jgi:hypothetical protein
MNNIRADRQDLRADRHDLRADAQDLRTAKPGQVTQAQRFARSDVKPGTTSVTTAKVQLTPSTLANNAAENSKKNQHQQTVHKAWYHWLF